MGHSDRSRIFINQICVCYGCTYDRYQYACAYIEVKERIEGKLNVIPSNASSVFKTSISRISHFAHNSTEIRPSFSYRFISPKKEKKSFNFDLDSL